MDSRPENGRQTITAGINSNERMVQGKQTPADAGTMENAESKNNWTLCVLWNKSQLQKPCRIL